MVIGGRLLGRSLVGGVRCLRRLSSTTTAVPMVAALDVAGPNQTPKVLAAWLKDNPNARIVALLGKADGINAGAHPIGPAVCSEVEGLLAAHAPNADQPAVIMLSSGAEGVEWPRLLVFCENTPPQAALDARALAAPEPGEARLAFASAFTREFEPHELGTLEQAEATRQAVLAACAEAGIDPTHGLCHVQVQCPLLTDEELGVARAAWQARRGPPTIAETSVESAGYSRGASALGVGFATGEVKHVTQPDICANLLLFSSLAAASARPGIKYSEVFVIGNVVGSASTLRAANAVMADAADVGAVLRALEAEGLDMTAEGASPHEGAHLTASAHERIVAVLAKADGASTLERPPLSEERWTDSNVLASQFACTSVAAGLRRLLSNNGGPEGRIFVAGGAEHQGPAGGGPVCVIYSCLLGDEYWSHVREGYFP